MFDIETYHRATSLQHAVALAASHPQARLIAGGTDVLIQLHHLNASYRHVVDIHGLDELRGISRNESGEIRIGSGTTFSELIDCPLIQTHLPALAAAAASIAGPQIRNVATYGGNICNGATSADSATPSLVYDARLEIVSERGTRFTPVLGFHTGPGKVALEPGEIAVAFHFPAQPADSTGSAHFKYAMRDAMDIATIGSAAWCHIDAGGFKALRLAFGVAAPTPIRCRHAEAAAQGEAISEKTLSAITEALLQDVSPRSSWRAEKDFRLHLIQTMAKHVIRQAVVHAGGEL